MYSPGKVLRWLLVLAAICAMIWLGVVAYWQETRRAVDEVDVALFIAALPLAVFAITVGGWYGAAAIRRARAAQPVATTNANRDSPALDVHDVEHRFQLAVHAVAMNTAAGVDTETVLTVLQEKRALAAPSKDIFDAGGFRVAMARVASLDLAEASDCYRGWLKTQDPARHPDDEQTERLLRCLALLAPPLEEIFNVLPALLQPPKAQATAPTLRPSARPAAATWPPPTLRVVVLASDDFGDAARAALKARLEPLLASAVAASRAPVSLLIPPRIGDSAAVQILDRFTVEANRSGLPDVLLLIGVDSLADAASVGRLERMGRLRTATQPRGETPGEGAFAILLRATPAQATEPVPLARVHRAAQTTRERAVDERGKVSSVALRDAVASALADTALEAGTCGSLVCDGDGLGVRGAEAAETMNACLGRLDAVADRMDLAAVFGHLGAASFVASLGIAATQCRVAQTACVVAGLASPLARYALVVVPASESAETPVV